MRYAHKTRTKVVNKNVSQDYLLYKKITKDLFLLYKLSYKDQILNRKDIKEKMNF